MKSLSVSPGSRIEQNCNFRDIHMGLKLDLYAKGITGIEGVPKQDGTL
jgi:hypothetical protein